MKMNAIGITQFGDAQVLKPIQVERPKITDKQVLIKVQGTSINYADIQTRQGSFHGKNTEFPLIPGLDAMGIIEETGNLVTDLKKGQRVIAFPHSGTYCEYVAVDEDLAFPIPDSISFEQAVACPLVAFASHMLLNQVSHFQSGETLLIHAAAGGIGTTAIQIAKSMGAGTIIGTVRKKEKIDQALLAGADFVICGTEDFVAQTNQLTNGCGADVILDSLGSTYTAQGMDCLAPYGRMVVFGNATGSYTSLDTGLLHSSCRSVLGFSSVTTRKTKPQWFSETAKSVIQLMVSGEIRMHVSAVFDLADAQQAHRRMESGESSGKILLRI